MSIASGPEYWIQRCFLEKKNKNTSYSLRSYSRFLGVSPSRLSQVLNGKRRISQKMALKLMDRLNLDPLSRQRYILSIKTLKKQTKKSDSPGSQQFLVNQQQFEVIADPLHFTLLSLMECDDFISDIDWMAKRLERDKHSIKAALTNLSNLQFIQFVNDQWVLNKTHGFTTTDHEVNVALRKSHKLQMEKAMEALDLVPVELRDFTSEIMAIDIDRLPQAKLLIRDFRKQLSKLLESGKKQNVYQLSVQLVPLTKTQQPQR